LNQIEKRGLISSLEKWQEVRNLRNLFIHDYPNTDDFKAQILTKAYQETGALLYVMDNRANY